MSLKIDDRVETKIAPPHPAAFAGVIVAIGEENGRILVRGNGQWTGTDRVYTPQSLRPAN